MTARVAVVIPLYNHEAYIVEGLRSLLAQSRPPDAIFVVDDGSTDGSLAAARSVDDSRIRIESGPNRGAHAALNRGVALTEGFDLVAILNSDDRFAPERLERCAAWMELHPETRLLCTRLRLIDPSGQPLAADEPRSRWFAAAWSAGTPADLCAWLGRANFAGTTSNFVARRDWLVAHPFGPYRYVHDYHALIYAAIEGGLSVLDESLLDYRVHPGNTITTAPERLIREVLRMHVDVARQLAPSLGSDSAARAAWIDYLRAAWGNVSAFRADLFQVLSAQALAGLTESELEARIDAMDPERYPEIREFPNRALVNLAGGAAAGESDAALAETVARLQRERALLKREREDRRLLARILEVAARSRWIAIGGLLGAGRGLGDAGAADPAARLEAIRGRLAASAWLRLGDRLGSRSVKRIAALLARNP